MPSSPRTARPSASACCRTPRNAPSASPICTSILPVWDSPMVEIGGGRDTEPSALDALADLARAIRILPCASNAKARVSSSIASGVPSKKKSCAWRTAASPASRISTAPGCSSSAATNPRPSPRWTASAWMSSAIIELHYAAESGDPNDLPPAILTDKVERGELGVKDRHAASYSYPDPAWQAADFLSPDIIARDGQ